MTAASGENTTENRSWTGQTMGSRLGHFGFFLLMRIFGRRFAGGILVTVSLFYYLFRPKVRKDSLPYLSRRFPHSGKTALTWHGWRLVHSFSEVLLDRLYLRLRGGQGFQVEFPDTQRIRDALETGKGVLLLSAHMGNWEVAGRFFGRLGAPVSVVMFENERTEIRELYEKLSREGTLPYQPIFSNDPIDTILRVHRALAQNHIVVMHGDRSLTNGGIMVPFLGFVACFPDAPYRIAAATGAAVVPTFCVRQGISRYLVKALPHFTVENTGEGIEAAGRSFVAAVEECVQRYPYQWYNFYDFWNNGESQ